MSDYDDPVTDFTDSQYRAPIQTPPSGGSGIEWLPSMPFAGRGKRVCNEADPSWEEVITMVVIPGHPEKIREASGSWEVLFRNIEQAKSMVDQVVGGVSSWEGQTAESFKGHMTNVSQNMTELVARHRPVVQQLNTSADNLQSALDNCPIPEEMVDDVMRARQNFGEAGNLDVVNTGKIFDVMYPVFLGWAMSALTSLFGIDDWVKRKLRDWISDGDDQAKQAYKSLAGQHVTTMDAMPKSSNLLTQELEQTTITPTIPPGGKAPSAPPTMGGGGGPNPDDYDTSLAGAGGLSGIGSGAGGPGLGGLAGGPGGPGALAGAGGPSLSAGPPPSPTSAGAAIRGGGMGGMPMGGMGGMAGAGGAGGARTPSTRGVGVPSARTPGMGGMPMGGMAGAGGAGRGGTRTPGVGGAGRAGGVGAGMAGMGAGAAGAGGRGAGGTRTGGVPGGGVAGGAGGRGAGARGAGMAGMGAGAGAGGDQAADHTTWLEEDEDVWGTDTDAAPPVLG